MTCIPRGGPPQSRPGRLAAGPLAVRQGSAPAEGPAVRVFVDFDGTITRRDVGDEMFASFGCAETCAAIIDEYRQGRISAVECFERECRACGDVDRQALDEFLDGEAIDPSFPDFVRFCRDNEFDLVVVSDGMDYYIRRILGRHGAGDVPFLSNVLDFAAGSVPGTVRFSPRFPHRDETCDRCASCKRNHMLLRSGDEDLIVYAGEGFSDRCPVRYADIVFAKDELLRFCEEENISYFRYESFADVGRRLGSMPGLVPGRRAGGLRKWKRRRAELARREVYAGG